MTKKIKEAIKQDAEWIDDYKERQIFLESNIEKIINHPEAVYLRKALKQRIDGDIVKDFIRFALNSADDMGPRSSDGDEAFKELEALLSKIKKERPDDV